MTNAPKAFELAIYETIRDFVTVGDSVSFRPWQSLAAVVTDSDYARHFPCIDIRCTPPSTDENGVTKNCTALIRCGTIEADDLSHADVTILYEAVQGVCDTLYYQDQGTTGAELTAFKASLTAYAPLLTFGGFTFGDGMEPYEDEGINTIGITLAVNYSLESA